jgi:methylamine utilization protein MauE
MVETITPVVHGGRRARWRAAVALHVLGATASAAAFGAALGLLGRTLGAPWGTAGPLLVAGVAALYALREWPGLPVPVPERRRQVPEWWRTFFPWPVSSFLYGLGLGIGFLTFLRHGTLVAVAAGAAATGRPLLGLAVMAPFGLARSLTVSVAGRASDAAGIRRLVDALERFGRRLGPRLASLGALLAVGGGAVAWAASASGAVGSRPALGVGAVFAWASLAKLLAPGRWRAGLERYDLPGWLRLPALAGTPLAEAAVPVLVLAGRPRAAGLLALGLLAAFSGALAWARTRLGDRVPCSCFGRTRERDVRLLLLRNAGLAALAAIVAAGGAPVRVELPPAPSGGEWVAAALAVLGAAAILVLLARGLTVSPAPPPSASPPR